MADVQKSAFMLSSATVMISPFGGTPVWDLVPNTHSVGMTKEVTVNVDSGSIDLMNGVAQALVESRKTNVNATISCNIHEYTAQNFLYAQGLSTTPVQIKRGKLSAAVVPAATSLSVLTDALPNDSNSSITAVTDIPIGSTIIIQDAVNPDRTFVTKSTATTTGTGPYIVTIASPYAIPTGVNFAINDHVYIVNQIGVADISQDNLVGLKIVGTLSNFDRPVVAVFPKCRVTKGFNLSFTETEYGAMPWEIRPLLLSATEATGRLADIGTRAPGAVYAG